MDCLLYPEEFTCHGVYLANDHNLKGKASDLKVNANIKTDFVLTCDADIIEVNDEILR